MYMFIVALHVVLCVLLILIIILQPGKGGDVGAAFGGAGGSNIFGPRGPTNLLSQMTTAVAVMFMVTSVTLAWYSNRALLSGSGDTLDAIEELQREEQELDEADQAEDAAAPIEIPMEFEEVSPAEDEVPADEAPSPDGAGLEGGDPDEAPADE